MAAGFDYAPDEPSGINRFRHFVSLFGSCRTKAGTFAIPAGFTGNIAITGVGFQPKAVFVMGIFLTYGDQGTAFRSFGNLHLGMGTDNGDQWAGGAYWRNLGQGKSAVWRNNKIVAAVFGADVLEAGLVSMDSDGFTINVTDSYASGNVDIGDSIRMVYLAIWGEGGFAIGTGESPAATGTQAISGLGFQPSSVFFASAHRPSLGAGIDDIARLMFGAGDGTNQYIAWTGSNQGDVFCDHAALSGRCISLMEDANSSGPFQPTPQDEASLQSLDADGFTLNWFDTDGVGRFYSWFAAEEMEIGRWTYNGFLNKPVATERKPEGLIFFHNDAGTESLDHNTATHAMTIGLGICDENLVQYICQCAENDAPSFSVPVSVRSVMFNKAFGAYAARVGGGTTANYPGDRGVITLLKSAEIPLIVRYR
jgi:predicted membrane protein